MWVGLCGCVGAQRALKGEPALEEQPDNGEQGTGDTAPCIVEQKSGTRIRRYVAPGHPSHSPCSSNAPLTQVPTSTCVGASHRNQPLLLKCFDTSPTSTRVGCITPKPTPAAAGVPQGSGPLRVPVERDTLATDQLAGKLSFVYNDLVVRGAGWLGLNSWVGWACLYSVIWWSG